MKDKDILDPYSTQRSQQENNEVKRLTYQYIEKTDRNDPNYQWSLAE